MEILIESYNKLENHINFLFQENKELKKDIDELKDENKELKQKNLVLRSLPPGFGGEDYLRAKRDVEYHKDHSHYLVYLDCHM